MANLNMANMNTLFKKGYLLAGVVMAANMFVVNEVRASSKPQTKPSTQPNNLNNNLDIKIVELKEIEKGTGAQENPDVPGTNIFGKVLSYENIINLFGGLAFSCVNNYFKWWDYNPGTYCKFVWFGWRSKRFLYDVVQFEFNFNLGRGALWSFIHIINRIKTSGKSEKDNNSSWTSFFLKDILRGFTSMPLTFHISKFNFSISLSLDSIIWMGIDMYSDKNDGKEGNQEKKDENFENKDPNENANEENNLNANNPPTTNE